LKQLIRLKIEKIAMGGFGLAYNDGRAIFVPYTVPEDIVEIVLTHISKNYAFGKVVNFISYADSRIKVNCDAFAAKNACGGCDWLMLKYTEQLKYKDQLIQDVFSPFIKQDIILPIVASPKANHYRNKVFMPVAENRKTGKISYGIYERFSHRVVEHKSCENHPPDFDLLANEIMEFCTTTNIKPYNEIQHRGQLRHIGFRCSADTSEILVILVTLGAKLPFTKLLVKKLTADFPQIKGIIQNINREKGNVILGDEEKLLFGSKHFIDTLNNIKFRVNYRSFWQINSGTMANILNIISSQVNSEDVILDTYCGIGTIGISLAAKVKRVVLMEELSAAIDDAKENARMNDIDNVSFVLGKVEDNLASILAKENITKIILDPPRSGVNKNALEAIIQTDLKEIIYLSCSPMTLARDIKILSASDRYTIGYLQPFDMFPNTWHIECLAFLFHKDYNVNREQ